MFGFAIGAISTQVRQYRSWCTLQVIWLFFLLFTFSLCKNLSNRRDIQEVMKSFQQLALGGKSGWPVLGDAMMLSRPSSTNSRWTGTGYLEDLTVDNVSPIKMRIVSLIKSSIVGYEGSQSPTRGWTSPSASPFGVLEKHDGRAATLCPRISTLAHTLCFEVLR